MDEDSCSAAEIFAGAMRDQCRAIVLSTGSRSWFSWPLGSFRTFGKGTVQIPFSLSDGSELLVTTHLVATPLGFPINGCGLRLNGIDFLAREFPFRFGVRRFMQRSGEWPKTICKQIFNQRTPIHMTKTAPSKIAAGQVLSLDHRNHRVCRQIQRHRLDKGITPLFR
jgi:hypothetical protein